MISLRIQHLLVALAVCLQITNVLSAKEYDPSCTHCMGGDDAEDEKDNQQACKENMDSLFKTAQGFLEKSNLQCFNITNPPPCEACELTGVHKVEIYAATQSNVVDCSGGVKCVDHTLYLKVPDLRAKCYCECDSDPKELMAQMQGVMTKENFGMKCDAPPGVIAKLPKPAIPDVFTDPTKLASLKSCCPVPIPDVPKVPGIGKRSTKHKGFINAHWPNIKLAITIRACKGKEYIVMSGAALQDPKMDDLTTTCEGPKEFMTPCNCMLEAQFLKTLLIQGIQFIFPCYCDEATKGKEQEINKMHCKPYFGLD